MSGFADPRYVREQYATEHGLAARKSIYDDTTGPDAREVLFAAVAEVAPSDVLDLGCGEGEIAERIAEELGAAVVAIDQSERMVEITRGRGLDARVGDAQDLEFEDASFDVVVAAWMLYHVADLDRALNEIARVLRPGGRLVAATNYSDHLHEMLALVGIERWLLPFSGENGAEVLRRVFPRVEEREARGTVTIRDSEAVRRYLGSSAQFRPHVDKVPRFDEPLVVRRGPTIFVAIA